jgi:hypothetical protein
MNPSATHIKAPRSWIPFWLMLLPMLAVVGGFITLYLVIKHPDQEIAVDKVTVVKDEAGTHQHVVNSVTPPLK